VKKANRKPTGSGRQTDGFVLAILLLIPLLLVGNGGPYAQDPPSPSPSGPPMDEAFSKGAGRILFSTDDLLMDIENNFAELRGNVRIVQDDLTITADTVKVLFSGDISGKDTAAMDGAAFQQIVARGHVSLTFDNKTAFADLAVYHTERQVLVLSGEDTTVMMGDSSITGTQITLHRIDGRIEVEAKGETRVEGVFFSGEGEGMAKR
jgi:lipopolysaccharide transport protein LptA